MLAGSLLRAAFTSSCSVRKSPLVSLSMGTSVFTLRSAKLGRGCVARQDRVRDVLRSRCGSTGRRERARTGFAADGPAFLGDFRSFQANCGVFLKSQHRLTLWPGAISV